MADLLSEAAIRNLQDIVVRAENGGFVPPAVLQAATALLSSTDDEFFIEKHVQEGHTEHCAKRLVWGDGECECGKLPPKEAAPKTIRDWQKAIHEYAKEKGWWLPEKPRSFGDICALLHTEISEAFEEYRNGHGLTKVYENPDKPGKLEGVPVELADLVIRVLDFCEWAGIDLQEVMARKHAFNLTRPYRHGNKTV